MNIPYEYLLLVSKNAMCAFFLLHVIIKKPYRSCHFVNQLIQFFCLTIKVTGKMHLLKNFLFPSSDRVLILQVCPAEQRAEGLEQGGIQHEHVVLHEPERDVARLWYRSWFGAANHPSHSYLLAKQNSYRHRSYRGSKQVRPRKGDNLSRNMIKAFECQY